MDAQLLPYITSTADGAEQCLSAIVTEQTEATVKGIIRSRLRVSLTAGDGSHNNQEALDLLVEIQTDLMAGLRALKRDHPVRTIDNLQNYVATIAFNACHQWLRRKYPKRVQLKNQLRYLLTHEPEFEFWESHPREWVGGLRGWRQADRAVSTSDQVERLHGSFSHNAASKTSSRDRLIGLVRAVFGTLQAPVVLDDLVNFTARENGVREDVAVDDLHLVRTGADVHVTLERRDDLRRLWAAIRELPHRHRAALLLNLREGAGRSAIEFLPLARVATIAEIASTLSFSPDEFARIWNELPWDDLRIARHLGLSRQQVINLRQSARARLARVSIDG